MTDEDRDRGVENALLRGALWLAVRRLRDYHDAPHFEVEGEEGGPRAEVVVPEDLREKAAEAIAGAESLLQGSNRGRGR